METTKVAGLDGVRAVGPLHALERRTTYTRSPKGRQQLVDIIIICTKTAVTLAVDGLLVSPTSSKTSLEETAFHQLPFLHTFPIRKCKKPPEHRRKQTLTTPIPIGPPSTLCTCCCLDPSAVPTLSPPGDSEMEENTTTDDPSTTNRRRQPEIWREVGDNEEEEVKED